MSVERSLLPLSRTGPGTGARTHRCDRAACLEAKGGLCALESVHSFAASAPRATTAEQINVQLSAFPNSRPRIEVKTKHVIDSLLSGAAPLFRSPDELFIARRTGQFNSLFDVALARQFDDFMKGPPVLSLPLM